MPDAWSKIEVELIVQDYFNMLSEELENKNYSKTNHRRILLPFLDNRSEGSVEFKHQNISAILSNLGQPFIKGYLPRFNYQRILEDTVLTYLIDNINIEEQFKKFSEKEINSLKGSLNFEKLLVAPPNVSFISEPNNYYDSYPIKVNYLEREQNNQKLGTIGEELALDYEKWSLIKIGKGNLADRVEWISKEIGDGAGFDILSRYPNGKDKYIEVKTTKLSKETPFYFTRNELIFSMGHSSDFHLYRVFNIEEQAKMFIKKGDFNSICHSVPMTYKGYF